MKYFLLVIALQIILYDLNDVIAINSAKSWPPDYEVCYGVEGCFSNSYPFNNSGNFLPVSPEVLNTEFLLFTRDNQKNEDYLKYNDENSLRSSNFDKSLPLKILIHGFTHKKNTPWIVALKDEILKKERANVVIVGWGNGCTFPLYANATANTRMVGKQIGLLVNSLRSVFYSSNPQDLKIHCIGHSLGSHTCAYGSNAALIRFNRITALDPAGPSFENTPIQVRVDPTDADFVDVMHTNGATTGLLSGSYGMVSPVGHVDFFVNGGYIQPGCPSITNIGSSSLDLESLVACSHMRAVYLFTETVSSDCNMLGFSCSSQSSFNKGECTSCENNKCAIMGYNSNDFVNGGSMYLNTNPATPFCGYHHIFEIKVSPQSRQATGDISIKINADTSNIIKPIVGEGISSGSVIKKLVQSKYDITSIDLFEMTFTKKVSLIIPGFYPDSFIMDKIKFTNMERNLTFSSCSPNTILTTDITKKFTMIEGDCDL